MNNEEIVAGVGKSMESALGAFFGSAEDVFSSPSEVGDVTIITASAWERAGGFGFGGGRDQGGDGGGGGGGGGSVTGRPVAVIEIGRAGVFVRPVFDFTKIGITLLAGFLAVWRAGRRK